MGKKNYLRKILPALGTPISRLRRTQGATSQGATAGLSSSVFREFLSFTAGQASSGTLSHDGVRTSVLCGPPRRLIVEQFFHDPQSPGSVARKKKTVRSCAWPLRNRPLFPVWQDIEKKKFSHIFTGWFDSEASMATIVYSGDTN